MELIDATSAAGVVTAVTSVITANMAGILVLFGTMVGLAVARGFLNRAKKGRV